LAKQQNSDTSRPGLNSAEPAPVPEPEPEPKSEPESELERNTVRRQAYEAYTRMLDENALWKAPEWLATQQMAAAGIATPYLHRLKPYYRQTPMRHGAGGAGNRWVADLAGMQSGSDRACRMQLAVDASPRGTPCSLVSQQRFPSRSRLVKPQTSPQTESEASILHDVPPAQTERRITSSGYVGEASQDLLQSELSSSLTAAVRQQGLAEQQSEHRVRPIGPAGFRSPDRCATLSNMALSQRPPATSKSPVRALFRVADNPKGGQHVPSAPTTPTSANDAHQIRYITVPPANIARPMIDVCPVMCCCFAQGSKGWRANASWRRTTTCIHVWQVLLMPRKWNSVATCYVSPPPHNFLPPSHPVL
jgi:hypothetical protein